MSRPLLVALLVLLAALAAGLSAPAAGSALPLAFSTTMIDTVRAGGEPVVQVTPHGTILVAAHPGWTHTRYPPTPDLLTPATGQSYMWRSTDDGATWVPVGLPMTPGIGPRGVGQGISDPDFALASNGRVYFTDLVGLATASVSWSDDDGRTFLLGNDVAAAYGGGPIDRNWIATHGTDVYLMGNYEIGEHVLESTDGGVTWSVVGDSPCAEQFVTDDAGDLVVACPTGIAVSADDGRTFSYRNVPGASASSRMMASPAFDAAGNVYVTWASGDGIWAAGSPDLGLHWFPSVHVSLPLFASGVGTHIWPYVVAGDAGRIAVAWYGTSAGGGADAAHGDWFLYEATVVGADTATPAVAATQVTATPIHSGYICQSGTTCQANAGASGDRRMGDFFEAAVDANGLVDVAYSVTSGSDSISHPGFAHQVAGPALKAS